MFQDERGVAFTTSSEQAAAAFNAGVDSFLGHTLALGGSIKEALAADPGFLMAHVVKGYVMMLFGTVGTLPSGRRSLAAAEAAAGEATERERLHVAALRAWSVGDMGACNRAFEQVLAGHPQDLLALKLLQFNYFWQGDSANVRDAVGRVLPHWSEATPGFGYVSGMHAFGLEECGAYAEAERAGRRAVEIFPRDHWAAHAVAHVLEMQGRQREGVDWLDGLRGHWDGINNFGIHLWWHRVLFHLELEQYGRALALYDEEVRKERTDFHTDLQNAISLLWRLELRGVDVGPRWEELADFAEQRIEDPAVPFSDLHYVMALMAAGRAGPARKLVAQRRAHAASATDSNGPVMAEVSVPLCEALIAFREGHCGEAAEKMQGLRGEIIRTGGSHAQRDVFAQTMIAAALRGERHALAGEWLAERTREKSGSPDAWRGYALALEGCGDAPGAAAARGRMDALLATS